MGMSPGTPSQITIAMLIFFILFGSIAWLQPYESSADTQIQLLCSVTTFMTWGTAFITTVESEIPNYLVITVLIFGTTVPICLGAVVFAYDGYNALDEIKEYKDFRAEMQKKEIEEEEGNQGEVEQKRAAISAGMLWKIKAGQARESRSRDERLPVTEDSSKEAAESEEAKEDGYSPEGGCPMQVELDSVSD